MRLRLRLRKAKLVQGGVGVRVHFDFASPPRSPSFQKINQPELLHNHFDFALGRGRGQDIGQLDPSFFVWRGGGGVRLRLRHRTSQLWVGGGLALWLRVRLTPGSPETNVGIF